MHLENIFNLIQFSLILFLPAAIPTATHCAKGGREAEEEEDRGRVAKDRWEQI